MYFSNSVGAPLLAPIVSRIVSIYPKVLPTQLTIAKPWPKRPKSMPRRQTKKQRVVSRASRQDEELLERFLVRSLKAADRYRATEYWNELEGTRWQSNQAVFRAAVSSGMDLSSVASPLFKDEDFIKSLFQEVDSWLVGIQIWPKLSEAWRADPKIGYHAVKLAVADLKHLPDELKNEESIHEALRHGILQ